ncbi:hypothetical protein U9M48_043079 [Paspalum notatum var. saurae]|uniref:Reverse transcriptase domain-containing protein n=1 Tax=Paspalum notatum var. saurae TaxID=547442 RepID=A0AAQ3UU61_PASNO
MWVTAASMHFEANAAKWLQAYKKSHSLGSGASFCKDVGEKFCADDYHIALTELLALTQTGTVEEYTAAFESLQFEICLHNSKYYDLFFVSKYIAGLRDGIGDTMESQLPPTVDKAVAYCKNSTTRAPYDAILGYKLISLCNVIGQIWFDLDSLLIKHDLSSLEQPFTKEEIDSVVAHLPSFKSPGPDGNLCLQSINGSYITLLPKCPAPNKVSDYRPISLLNCSIKLITKLLANRLQRVIQPLIHKNQYGFIQSRTIQDCLAWAFEYLHICHHSKKELVILKLDFEKAFDKVEHQEMLELMKAKGFGQKWLHWMSLVMNSGTSLVLLNGIPRKTFHCRRGVRQGDPLSPLLFVIAADLLQTIPNKARELGLIALPIPLNHTSDFPVLQYVDDTLIIMEGMPNNSSVGLKVNFAKSCMTPINLTDEKFLILSNTFGCSQGTLPFTYLGLPLGLTKPKAERLEIVNSVLTSQASFAIATFSLPETALQQINKYRKHCLWRGADMNDRTLPKAAWPLVCSRKESGGLGVTRLKTQNEALQMKFLHKFFNRIDIPWVHLIWEKYYSSGSLPKIKSKGSFWWRDVLKLLDKFKGMARPIIGNGNSCYFWDDLWSSNVLAAMFPELHSFAKNKNLSLQGFLSHEDSASLFHLPLSVQAYQQFLELPSLLQVVSLQDDSDTWTYIWGNTQYSTKKAYVHLSGYRSVHPAFKWLWDSSCQNKHKVFFWLLLVDRLSTREILRRKSMHLPSYNCVLCHFGIEESLTHLFLFCDFSKQCWGLLGLSIEHHRSVFQNFQRFKVMLGKNCCDDLDLDSVTETEQDLRCDRGRKPYLYVVGPDHACYIMRGKGLAHEATFIVHTLPHKCATDLALPLSG